jgi:hypothetical protein
VKRALAVLRRRALGVAALAAAGVLALTLWTVPSASGAFTAGITNSADTAGTATYFTCRDAIAPDLSSAYLEWPLTDASGAISPADLSGNNRSATFVGTTTTDASAPLGCPRDGGSAWKLDGSTNSAYSATAMSAPQVFTIELSFQTTVKAGRLIGFGNQTTGASVNYDRQIYINSDGALTFGVYNSGARTITSTATVTDGAWHHVAATMSSNGMKLYLDGRSVGTPLANSAAESTTGYWRVGYDNLNGWPKPPTSYFFNGRIRNVGVYTVELTAEQIANHAAPTFGS